VTFFRYLAFRHTASGACPFPDFPRASNLFPQIVPSAFGTGVPSVRSRFWLFPSGPCGGVPRRCSFLQHLFLFLEVAAFFLVLLCGVKVVFREFPFPLSLLLARAIFWKLLDKPLKNSHFGVRGLYFTLSNTLVFTQTWLLKHPPWRKDRQALCKIG